MTAAEREKRGQDPFPPSHSSGKRVLTPFFLPFFPFLLFAAWILPGLLGHDPWKPDEAYTFGIVFHILESGDWLVPTLAGEPFVEKPPLYFWTAALFARLFGWALPLHDAARLASALYASLTLWFTYLSARTMRIGTPLSAPLLLGACLGYLQHAHQLLTDNALMAGIALAIYGLVSRRPLLLGTGAGMAFLSKGLLGPGMLALTAVALLSFREWRTRAFVRSWLPALAAFLPWALVWPWLLYRHSPALFDEWFWVNNFGRFTGSAGLGGVLDHAHYAKALVWFALPAWPLAACALWNRFRTERLEPPMLVAATSFGVMFVVLSTASSARTLYGLPMLVPLALLAAYGLESAPRWLAAPLEAAGTWGGAACGLALALAWLAFAAGWRPAFLESQAPGFVPGISVVGVGVAAALVVMWFAALRFEPRLPVRWLAGVALAWGLAMTLWLPWLDHAKSYRGVIADLRAHKPEGCIAARGLTEPQRAMFHYFAGIRAPEKGDCPLLLIHGGNAEPPVPGEAWRLVWRGTRPADAKEFFWLFAR